MLLPSLFASIGIANTNERDDQAGWLAATVSVEGINKSFAYYVNQLSLSVPSGIVADGLPSQDFADLKLKGPLREALDRLADRFDFSWRVSKSKAITFTRRFHKWEEYPGLGIAETRHTSEDILDLVKSVAPDTSHDVHVRLMNSFYRTLTAQQRQVLKSGGTLWYSDLDIAQTDLVRASIVGGHFESFARPWRQLFDIFTDLPRGTLVLRESRGISGAPKVVMTQADERKGGTEFAVIVPRKQTGTSYPITIAEVISMNHK